MIMYFSYTDIEHIIAAQYNKIVNIRKVNNQIHLTLPEGYYLESNETIENSFWEDLKKSIKNFITKHWDFDFIITAESGKFYIQVNDITFADDIVNEISKVGSFILRTSETTCEIDLTLLLALLSSENSISPSVKCRNVQMEQKGVYLNFEIN